MSIIFKMLKYLKNYSNLITMCIIIALVTGITVHAVRYNDQKSSYKEEISALQTELNSLKTPNKELETEASKQEVTLTLATDDKTVLLDKDAETQTLEEKPTESFKKPTETVVITTRPVTQTTSVSSTKPFKADGNYNQATQVWQGLKAAGLNDYVCAGIMGNIMAEVGGQTLDISRWSQYSQSSYYGICQWSAGRKQRLLNDFGTTLDAQIEFLVVELFEVIPKGNSFYNMQDEKEAALYFAKYYERCGSGSYSIRQTNATKALEYFVG